MKKFKRLLALIIMGSALSSIFAAGADIVVLMDSSGTILPWFDEINSRILVDITKKFVREGDTFHLVSFNSRVNLEIAQPVETEADLSKIVSRFMLLYPLGQNSDFLSGLQYILQYVSSLDPQRQKIVIIISDGIFNPPTSSRYAAYTPDQVRAELSDVARRIRGSGWSVYYIKLPFPQNAEIRTLDGNLLASTSAGDSAKASGVKTAEGDAKAADGNKNSAQGASQNSTGQDSSAHQYYDVSKEFTSDLDIKASPLPEKDVPITFVDQVFAMPQVTFPADLGKRGRFFILPLKVTNDSNSSVNMELSGVYTGNDVNILAENSFLNLSSHSSGTLRAQINLPDTTPKGSQDINMRLQFSDNLRVLPQSATVHLTVTGFSFGQFFRTGSSVLFAVIIIVIAVLLVLFLILFVMRKTAKPASDAIRTANVNAVARGDAQVVSGETAAVAGAAYSSTARLPARSATVAATGQTKVSSAADSSVILNTAAAQAESSSGSKGISAQAAKATNAAASSVLAEAATSAQVSGRQNVEFHSEKKEYPTRTAAAAKLDVSGSMTALTAQQTEDKNERLSVLANAAVKRVPKAQGSRKGANANEQIEIRGSARIMVELDVRHQNPNVGKRNVHMIKAGSRLSVGGGQSSFLVFLVKFPARIAELRFDGVTCSLAILKPEYFPNETENLITDCIGKSFTILSDHGYEVTFGFKVYEDPVAKLNRLLTSIRY